jgi:hypothetical protein
MKEISLAVGVNARLTGLTGGGAEYNGKLGVVVEELGTSEWCVEIQLPESKTVKLDVLPEQLKVLALDRHAATITGKDRHKNSDDENDEPVHENAVVARVGKTWAEREAAMTVIDVEDLGVELRKGREFVRKAGSGDSPASSRPASSRPASGRRSSGGKTTHRTGVKSAPLRRAGPTQPRKTRPMSAVMRSPSTRAKVKVRPSTARPKAVAHTQKGAYRPSSAPAIAPQAGVGTQKMNRSASAGVGGRAMVGAMNGARQAHREYQRRAHQSQMLDRAFRKQQSGGRSKGPAIQQWASSASVEVHIIGGSARLGGTHLHMQPQRRIRSAKLSFGRSEGLGMATGGQWSTAEGAPVFQGQMRARRRTNMHHGEKQRPATAPAQRCR